MTNNTSRRYVDMSQFIVSVAQKGFELLALHLRAFPDYKISKRLISFHHNGQLYEANSWLCNLASQLILDNIELIDQEIIDCAEDFIKFTNTLPEHIQEDLLGDLIMSMEFYEFDESEINHISDIPISLLDDYIYNYPIRITTLSSTLFDLDSDFLVSMEDILPSIVANDCDLIFDSYFFSLINTIPENSFHPTCQYSTSFTIVTTASTELLNHYFFDSLPEPERLVHYLTSTLKDLYEHLLRDFNKESSISL